MNRKIAIILSHPIQYYSPFFAALNDEGFVFKVFYTLGDSDGIDAGFGKQIRWDLPLLQHYDYEFLSNMSSEPGSNHYNGIISPDLISTVERYNPEVILIYGWAYAAHLKAMKYFHSKVPIWFKGDSTLLDDLPYWKKITRKIALTYVYRHIDKAFYVGSNNYDYFRSFGLKNNQLIFAPHAIDNQRFAEDKFIHAEKIKKKLNISPDDIIVLFAGKFQAKKNPEILLKAFKSMKLDNVHLLMVGNGILEEKLKYKSQQLGLKSQKIHFMDFQNQSQMPAVYQACDIYCLPSKGPSETWGLSVNEAMASGKAVLLSDKVGCAIDLVDSGKNGYIFKSGDEYDLLAKLESMCSNRKALGNMGKRSFEIISSWNFQAQVESLKLALENL